jgi:dipeptidyl aminopeptidase/acylaminoacyl peptidase
VVFPHGGPEANDSFDFDTFCRLLAGLGYVVLQPEYRGSTGYGSDFLNAIYQHFGDRAYRDVDSATDFALATPLLILHGAADIRVPTYQGREFYLALAVRGKERDGSGTQDAKGLPGCVD